MSRTRKNHSKEFKAKVALEAVKGLRSLSELGARLTAPLYEEIGRLKMELDFVQKKL